MGYRKACKILIVTLMFVLLLTLSAAAEGNEPEELEVIEEVESTDTVLFLDKPFTDYTVTEGLLLVISAVCVGRLIYVIARKVMS